MDAPGSEDARSAAEREGIVDQQDAALAAMESAIDDETGDRDDTTPGADAVADEGNDGVNPSRPPAEGGRDEVDEALTRQHDAGDDA